MLSENEACDKKGVSARKKYPTTNDRAEQALHLRDYEYYLDF
jgi:hypothetical protein